MRRTLRPAALALVALLALTACGGDDAAGEDTTATTDGGTDTTTADGGTDTTTGDGGTDTTTGGETATLQVDASEFTFDPPDLTATTGELEIALENTGDIEHNFAIEGVQGDEPIVEDVPGGASGRGTVSLEPGEYTFYCSVPGHRENGMEGTLTVG